MPNVYRKYDTKTGIWADFGDLNARKDIGIVEDTDIAEHAIASGQYVIWKGNLYTANNAITVGTVLSTSNLVVVNNGGLNSLKNTTDGLNSTVTSLNSTVTSLNNSKNDYMKFLLKGVSSGSNVHIFNFSTTYNRIGVLFLVGTQLNNNTSPVGVSLNTNGTIQTNDSRASSGGTGKVKITFDENTWGSCLAVYPPKYVTMW